MLLAVYTHCIDGQDAITNRLIERALHARNQAHHQKASGSANRQYRPDPVRPFVRRWPTLTRPGRHLRNPAHPQPGLHATITIDCFRRSERIR